jgi:hypothetical protein
MEPANLEAECIPIVLLRALDIRNWQFWHGVANRRQRLSRAHEASSPNGSVVMAAA